MNCFKFRNGWMLVGMMAFMPMMAQGQTHMGPIALKASVSGIVALSLAPTPPQHNLRIDPQGDLKTLTLNLSGSAADPVEIRVPILIRSNTSFNISALVQSQTLSSANFVVLDARPIGRFVATDAVASLQVKVQNAAPNSLPLNLSAPLSILSGPRVSIAGTLNSPDNALEVIILIAVKPDPGAASWALSLSLAGSGTDRF